MSELGETPGNKTIRLTKEKKIFDYNKGGDGNKSDAELDTYRYGQARSDLSSSAMFLLLKRKGSKAARFFEAQAVIESNQETGEIPIVTPELLEKAA